MTGLEPLTGLDSDLSRLSIPEVSEVAFQRCQSRFRDLTMPLASLGELERMVCRVAAIRHEVIPRLSHPVAVLFAADHGVARQGVSRYRQTVTEEMAVNVLMGSATSSVLARQHGIPLQVVDVGLCRDVRHPRIISKKVACGTMDFCSGEAMTVSDAKTVFLRAAAHVDHLCDGGADALILGELGIGNTTSAAVLCAGLLTCSVEQLVGPGTGLDQAGLLHKQRIARTAFELHHAKQGDLWAWMAAVGGYELVAMAGAMMAAAHRQIPILLDGMVTGAAALWAVRLQPALALYLFAGHESSEPAHAVVLRELGLHPLLRLGLHLGEASGALFAWPILARACDVCAETATFADAQVDNPHGPHPDESVHGSASTRAAEGESSAEPPKTMPAPRDFTEAEVSAVYKAVAARRDIRVYLPDAVPDEVLARILWAGHHAPSVGYMQPWNFIVVRDEAMRVAFHQLADAERIRAGGPYAEDKRQYYLRLKLEGFLQAPITLCVTNSPNRGGPHVLGRHTIPETDLMSTACAIENMWLAARAEGVAMGWVSLYQKADVRSLLDIPDEVDPVALLTLGYTPDFPAIPVLERVGWGTRRKGDEVVYEERFGRVGPLSKHFTSALD